MPKLKERQVMFVKFQRLLKGYGYNGQNLSPILLVTPKTAKKKLDNPMLFTLEDVFRINKFGGIPIDEIREALVV